MDKRAEVLGALARGYCTERNSKKVLDPDLIEDMATEVIALFPEPSVEEILAEINKYGDYKNGVEWDYWKKGIALALSKLRIKGGRSRFKQSNNL